MPEELLGIADALYALPLADFTGSRDARAKQVRAADKELADRVKALRKPSTAAWVVNLLVRRDAAQVEQVLEVGAALREAAASMDGAELRALTRQRRQLTAAVTTRARGLAREQGLKVTTAVAEQVEGTLTAAMLDADAARAVRSGLLVTALSSTGLDSLDLSAAVAVPGALGFVPAPVEQPPGAETGEQPGRRPELRVVPDPDAELKARRAAQQRLAAAEQELTDAEQQQDAARQAVAELEAQSLQLQSELEEFRRRILQVEQRLEEVDDELAEAEDAAAEADQAVAELRRERERAAAEVARLR